MTRFLGIALASDPRRTAACLLEWVADAGTVVGLHQPVDDALAVELARDAALVAIDAPFGWPSPFVAAVSGHARRETWPAVTTRDLSYRRTDQRVAAEVGWWPLSVSTDRIGIVAFRAARLQALLRPGAEPGSATALYQRHHRGLPCRSAPSLGAAAPRLQAP